LPYTTYEQQSFLGTALTRNFDKLITCIEKLLTNKETIELTGISFETDQAAPPQIQDDAKVAAGFAAVQAIRDVLTANDNEHLKAMQKLRGCVTSDSAEGV